MKILKLLAINLALILAVIVCFDVVAYLVLPSTFTVAAYRVHTIDWSQTVGDYVYPRTYFQADPVRGFDIVPSSGPTAIQDDYFFPIERDELGCRDQKTAHEISPGYIYVAGDSGTWGLTPSVYRWTELLSRDVNQVVLNCGVSGTAQFHQHDKFRDVTTHVGHQPSLVLVAYVSNDVEEDFRYPARTIIDGYLVDTATIDYENGQPRRVPRDLDAVQKRLEEEREEYRRTALYQKAQGIS